MSSERSRPRVAPVPWKQVKAASASREIVLERWLEARTEAEVGQAAVEWLTRGVGLTWAALSRIDQASGREVEIASSGASRPYPPSLGCDPSATNLGLDPAVSIPLFCGRTGERRTWLLFTCRSGASSEDVRWLASIVGRRLAEVASKNTPDGDISSVARLAHEVRTPLSAIVGTTALLLADGASFDFERARAWAKRIDANARTLIDLVDDATSLARIDAGVEPARFEDVAVAGLAAEILDELTPLVVASGLAVTLHAAEGLVVRTDRRKAKQIVTNLVANALKFTSEGSVRVDCRLASRRDRVELAVIDSGTGIHPDEKARIFVPFHQLRVSQARGRRGVGLGLAIERSLAQQLGGDIGVDSEPGVGSTFTVSLPASSKPPLAKA